MQMLIAAAFICIILFLFLVFNIHIKDIAGELENKQREKSYLKASKQQHSRIAAVFVNIQTMLDGMGQKGKFYTVIGASLLLIVLGIGVGLCTRFIKKQLLYG